MMMIFLSLLFQAPISVDDIIERRRKENPKLKAHSLKRKRDSVTAPAKGENNGSDVDMVSDEEDATHSLQLSDDEGGEGVLLRSALWDLICFESSKSRLSWS